MRVYQFRHFGNEKSISYIASYSHTEHKMCAFCPLIAPTVHHRKIMNATILRYFACLYQPYPLIHTSAHYSRPTTQFSLCLTGIDPVSSRQTITLGLV